MKKEIITSRQNPRVREVCALSEKKKRRAEGLFRFDGIKLFSEALANGIEIESVFVRHPLSAALERLVCDAVYSGQLDEERVIYVSDSVFEKLSEEKNPEGILCVARIPRRLHMLSDGTCSQLGADERLLIVQSLRDPGNLGTVIRSCAALGIDRLLISSDCADLYNPKTVRSAMGALFHLPILTVDENGVPDMIRALRESGRRVYAAALCEGALLIGSFKLSPRDCFVIGNEGHGLPTETVEACDAAAIIPMKEGNESLNAAAAATVCIWETVRA